MQSANVSVYVIFADDEHGSEYTQPYDKRRNWISNFQGSAGTAVVSLRSAALWTDSRYFTQAELELDCANWLLMRSGLEGVPDIYAWIASEAANSTLVREIPILKRDRFHSSPSEGSGYDRRFYQCIVVVIGKQCSQRRWQTVERC